MPRDDLRIVLISQGINPISQRFLNDHRLVGVVESMPRAATDGVEVAPAPLPVRALHGLRRRFISLQTATARRHLPYFPLNHESQPQLRAWMSSRAPDVIIVYSMSQLLKAEVIECSRLGALNLHPSLLPAWRGPNPWPWVFLSDREHSGYTLHFLDSGEDTGPIVAQRRFAIPRGVPGSEFRAESLTRFGVPMVESALKQISEGEVLEGKSQPSHSPTARAARVTPAQISEIVDWKRWSPERVWHCLRGIPELTGYVAKALPAGRGNFWRAGDLVKDISPADVKAPIAEVVGGRPAIRIQGGVVFLTPHARFPSGKSLVSRAVTSYRVNR